MEKTSVFGALLYIGFVAEKGRGRSKGLWKIGYKKILRQHVGLWREIINQLMIDEIDGNDNIILKKFIEICDKERRIGKYYNISNETAQNCNAPVITTCNQSLNNNEINRLMLEITNDILAVLSGWMTVTDKQKCFWLIRALHNLPRCYLGEDFITPCNLKLTPITWRQAAQYSYDNIKMGFKYMDMEEQSKYKLLFHNAGVSQ